MGARVYIPRTARFLQTDPVYGGSANGYDYANQDPVNQLDLDGRVAADGRAYLGLSQCALGFTGRCSKRARLGVHVPIRALVRRAKRLGRAGFKGLESGAKEFLRTERDFWVARYRDIQDASDQELKNLTSGLCLIGSFYRDTGPSCDLGNAYNQNH